MSNKILINSIATLKRLEKKGLITLHPHTGQSVYWNGVYRKAWYIDDSKSRRFTDGRYEYVVEYQSGSFYPYLYRTI